ncbi:MAG: hypothetical protein NZ955_07395 [Candidatus Bathyarchaeota archaeon]|nr:hypothetical protein [Candidatus Bathyarchaeota archaeon]
MSRWSRLRSKLRGGFFLSSMGGVTDGAFCASRGRGCIMVQLGADMIGIAEPTKEDLNFIEKIVAKMKVKES